MTDRSRRTADGRRAPAWLAALAALCAACGGGEVDPAAQSSARPEAPRDLPPVIDSIELLPSEAQVGAELVLELEAHDPEGEPLALEIDWFVNGELRSTGGKRFETEGLEPFDQIEAGVRVKSGMHQSHARTQPLRLQPPPARARITEIRFLPDPPLASGSTTAEVHVDTPDPSVKPRVLYEWRVNGRVVSGADGPILEKGALRRGQRVAARAALQLEGGDLEWVDSPEVEVGNSAPEIDSKPPMSLPKGNLLYQYQVEASDPDDDRPLRYELVEGPPGMSVNLYSGILEWQITRSVSGTQNVEVAVVDGNGGRSSQRWELQISWPRSGDRN